MEHAVGEIVTMPDGRKAKVVENETCDGCAFIGTGCIVDQNKNRLGRCVGLERTDHTDIIYKEISDSKSNGGMTMDCKSLMLGDWVNWHTYTDRPNYCRITRINPDDEYKCEPIPLTTEILEKNGFVYDYDVDECVADYQYIKLKGYRLSGECYLIDYCAGRVQIENEFVGGCHIDVSYVHELQRALRCCGLWDIADSFKV